MRHAGKNGYAKERKVTKKIEKWNKGRYKNKGINGNESK